VPTGFLQLVALMCLSFFLCPRVLPYVMFCPSSSALLLFFLCPLVLLSLSSCPSFRPLVLLPLSLCPFLLLSSGSCYSVPMYFFICCLIIGRSPSQACAPPVRKLLPFFASFCTPSQACPPSTCHGPLRMTRCSPCSCPGRRKGYG
jgi:hypothetical protein